MMLWQSSSCAMLLFFVTFVDVTCANQTPSILVLLADDLGFGDLGCYGNATSVTPNIDGLAREGVKMTHHLATASVCTPSRAAILTGRYGIRSGMTPIGRGRVNVFIASKCSLPLSEITLAELAKQAGYKTALLGKWHLGLSKERFGDHEGHPLSHGFDYFYGLIGTNLDDFGPKGDRIALKFMPWVYWQIFAVWAIFTSSLHSLYREKYISLLTFVLIGLFLVVPCFSYYWRTNNLNFLSSMVHRNYDVVEQPIRLDTLSKKLVREGLEFLEQAMAENKPYFLLMSFSHMHTYLDTDKMFSGRSKHGIYGDALEELDWCVGKLLAYVDKSGRRNNTLVYFTSDHGGHQELGLEGGYNGGLTGGKSHGAVEGAIRVPGIIRWPGVIPANTLSDEPTSTMDFYSMLSKATGVPLPRDRTLDTKDILPLLKRETAISPHDFMFHYCESTVHGVRYRPRTGSVTWKLLYYYPNYLSNTTQCQFACTCEECKRLDPPLLFDITNDPTESSPIDSESPVYKKVVPKMVKATKVHTESVDEVESQFSSANMAWRPWLQPCCNGVFPFHCQCQDSKYPDI